MTARRTQTYLIEICSLTEMGNIDRIELGGHSHRWVRKNFLSCRVVVCDGSEGAHQIRGSHNRCSDQRKIAIFFQGIFWPLALSLAPIESVHLNASIADEEAGILLD